jgi:hypothetical protein
MKEWDEREGRRKRFQYASRSFIIFVTSGFQLYSIKAHRVLETFVVILIATIIFFQFA